MSPSSILKCEICPFASILPSFVMLFGSGMKPCCRLHLIISCADVHQYFFESENDGWIFITQCSSERRIRFHHNTILLAKGSDVCPCIERMDFYLIHCWNYP